MAKIPDDAEVEQILDKWIGPSDHGNKKDTFYLVKYKGFPAPKKSEIDAWVHPRGLIGAEDIIAEFEPIWAEQQRKKAEEKKYKSKRWEYVEEGKALAMKKQKTEDWNEIAKSAQQSVLDGSDETPTRRTRVKERKIDYSITEPLSQERRRQKPEKVIRSMINNEPPRGFDRNLEAERIVGCTVYKDVLLYNVKWKGLDQSDYVTEEDCREKCPNLIIEYLQPSIEEIEAQDP